MAYHFYGRAHVCGCYFMNPSSSSRERTYLPQVKLDAHTTILSTASRTVLKQIFVNPAKDDPISEIRYAFPLFDGVSVVEFKCQIRERTIYGLVKEKGEARKTYEEAKERGENAALLEQLPDASDVFTTSVSNIPPASSIEVTITYVQELKHDAEVDGVRLTLPTSIAPRYGNYPGQLLERSAVNDSGGISIAIDVSMGEGVTIRKILSPSHPIEVSLGTLSTSGTDDDPSISKASASLALGTAELERDFVLQVVAQDLGIPQAILETHPTLPNQRALMTTLVPKFNLKSQKPEIIFIADRSGSMAGNIPTLISALKVFLKSIPIGCMFNICSFGTKFEFLWPKSKLYGHDTLSHAIHYVDKFESDFGGTETLQAIKASFKRRLKGMPAELILLTDGDIWSQEELFTYIEEQTKAGDARVFPIGIGGGVSSALIEGVARVGRGFAQMVANNERLDSKIVRMLKGALTPHVKDYRLEVKYEDDNVSNVADGLRVRLTMDEDQNKEKEVKAKTKKAPISLYDPSTKEEHPKVDESRDIFAGLPKLDRPKILQTPAEMPALFPFNRACVYLLLSPDASDLRPISVILKGTSPQGPLELEIPVQIREQPDEMIHQLAARKAIQELEEGRGWVSVAHTEDGQSISDRYSAQFTLLQQQEAVRLGVEFQVGGKYCSFVAVEANEVEIAAKRKKAVDAITNKDAQQDDWEMLEHEVPPPYKVDAETEGMLEALEHQRMVCSQNLVHEINYCLSAPGTQMFNACVAGKSRARRAPTVGFALPSLGGLARSLGRRVSLKESSTAYASAQKLGMTHPLKLTARPALTQESGWSFTGGMVPRKQLVGGSARQSLQAVPTTAFNQPQQKRGSFQPEKSTKRFKTVANGLDLDTGDDSDENMGFGLFDDSSAGAPPPPPAPKTWGGGAFARLTGRKSSRGGGRRGGGAGLGSRSQPSAASVALHAGAAPKAIGRFSNPPQTQGSGRLLERLIARQSFEGAWTAISDLPCEEMNISCHAVHEAVKKLLSAAKGGLDKKKAETVLTTAIVVTFLEKKIPEEEETWELIVEKAKDWLKDAVAAETLAETWELAESIVGA